MAVTFVSTAASGAGGGLSDLVDDTTPQLGGDLDLNGNQITSPDGTDLLDIPNGSIDLQTASTSRLDITDSGVRLGAANARVTTILDEDTMSSDSATSLATQQSIKAYVDANAGGSNSGGPHSTGYWVPGPFFGAASVGSTLGKTLTTGTLYFVPFFVEETTTYTDIGVGITGTAGPNINMGIYNSSGGRPTGSPITNSTSGSVATSVNTFASYTFSSAIELTPGKYYIGVTVSGTTSSVGPRSGGYEAGQARFLGWSGTPDTSPVDTESVGGYSQSFTYSTTLPTVSTLSTYSSGSTTDIFAWLKVQ